MQKRRSRKSIAQLLSDLEYPAIPAAIKDRDHTGLWELREKSLHVLLFDFNNVGLPNRLNGDPTRIEVFGHSFDDPAFSCSIWTFEQDHELFSIDVKLPLQLK
jgi:hypothetical protein